MGPSARVLLARDKGFTLVELLVAIVVIAVLTGIAVPLFLHQRTKGYDAAVKSDLKSSAIVAETNYDPQSLGYASEQIFTDTNGELASDGTAYVGFADTDSYVLFGQSRSGKVFVLSSTNGGVPVPVTADGTGGGPVLATAGLHALAGGAAGEGGLPGLTDTPPEGIERPYAAISWGEGADGHLERDTMFFGDAGNPGTGDGPGGDGPVPTAGARIVYDLTLPTCDMLTDGALRVPAWGPDYTIDWGDGTVTPNNNVHTYAEPGRYTVSLSGHVERFGVDAYLAEDYFAYMLANRCIAEVISYDAPALGTTSLRDAFAYGSSLTSLGDFNSTGVTDMGEMLAMAISFNAPLNLDTSAVTKMDRMLYGAERFNQPVPFDTSNVTTMQGMFGNAAVFDQPVNFDTSNVTDMSGMFYNAHVFNQPVDFDTSNVTTMLQMFHKAWAFDQPVNFDTSNVTTMAEMFYATQVFNQPVLFDTSKVTSMSGMFSGARAFNQPVPFDTSKVTSFSMMFQDATAFSQDISGWDVSSHPAKPTSFSLRSGLTTAQLPPAWR